MRIKTWILALFMLATLFLLYRWLTTPQEDILNSQQPLLATDTSLLHTIHIERPQIKRLSLTRENKKWLVTDGENSSWVTTQDAKELLRALQKMRPLGFRQKENLPGKRITVQLVGQQKEVFQLSRTHPDTAFFHFPDLPEAYLIPSDAALPFFRPMRYYQSPTLLAWDTPDSILVEIDSFTLHSQRDTLYWRHPHPAIDSVRWDVWLTMLSRLPLPAEATQVEELLPDSLANHTLQLWDGGEPTRVLAFKPQVAGNLPLIWNSRYPDRYFSVPDSSWYHQLFPIWLDSLANSAAPSTVR